MAVSVLLLEFSAGAIAQGKKSLGMPRVRGFAVALLECDGAA
jgi:hypothetical protein